MSETISKFGHGGARANSGGARPGAGRPSSEGRAWKAPEIVVAPSCWCVYQTQPQAERRAAEEITRAGYHGYAPLIAVRKQDAVIRSLYHKVVVPRFPGYGFIQLGATDRWREPFQDMAGKPRILLDANGRPARLPVGEIESHMAQDAKLCDFARETMALIKTGTGVEITVGAFSGRSAVVNECTGIAVRVELNIFGREIDVWLDRASVFEEI